MSTIANRYYICAQCAAASKQPVPHTMGTITRHRMFFFFSIGLHVHVGMYLNCLILLAF